MVIAALHLAMLAAAATNQPTTAPADATLDWLMNQAQPTTAPAAVTRPAEEPATTQPVDDGYRPATLTLSNGETITGRLATTAGQPIRVWDPERKEYRDIPFSLIRSFEAKVLWEREQQEWHFKETGSEIREYSGKSYPVHELYYTVTLINGQSLTGGVVVPLYLKGPQRDRLFALHKRDKGELGQTLKDLIYVKRVDFDK